MASIHEKLQEFVAWAKENPSLVKTVIGENGRRTMIMPAPRPEDDREPYKAQGPVPEGYTRAEIVRPNYDQNDPNGRKGSFWVHVKHPDKTNHVLERVFRGDIVDIPDAEFEKLYERMWVREPKGTWTKKETKQQAA